MFPSGLVQELVDDGHPLVVGQLLAGPEVYIYIYIYICPVVFLCSYNCPIYIYIYSLSLYPPEAPPAGQREAS